MEDLIKLVEIVKKKGQRSIQLVNQNFRKKEISKDNQLYEGIVNGEFDSDQTAAKEMFGADAGNRNYRNAKAKLKTRLLNHLYFLDYEKEIYTRYDRALYECEHTLHHCRVLVMEESPDIAMRLLPHLIKVAKEFEFIDIYVTALEIMRSQYANMGKLTPFTETEDEYRKALKEQTVYRECDDVYYDIIVNINKSVSSQHRVLGKIPGAISKLEEKAKKLKSNRLKVMSYKLKLILNQISWKFQENIKLCTELEEKYLSDGNHNIKVNLSKTQIASIKLYSYFNTNNHKQGAKYAQENIKLFRSGSPEWFNFIEYYFLLMMRGLEFKKAGEIYRMVRTNKNYGEMPDIDRERWQIYRAFLIYVNDEKLLRWGFDLDQFIEKIPNYPKDLDSYNIAVLVVQFMFLLRDARIDRVRKVVAKIEEYSSIHLDKRSNYRNSIFIRLLSIVVEKDFNYELVKAKGANYHQKLKKTKIPCELIQDMEVIPYEILWDQTLLILRTNKLYVHYRFYKLHAIT